MRWIDIAWPMFSAASLTLAAIHVFIWLRKRDQYANLMFALCALSVAIVSLFELALMRARTPEQYETIVRWAHLPIVVLVFGLVGFILLRYRAGNISLAVGACTTRALCLLPNFLAGANLNFIEITKLRSMPAWGGDSIVIVDTAVPNPWMLLGNINVILLLLFVASAIREIWRRGPSPDRRRALLVCAGMVLFLLLAGSWTWAVVHGDVTGPLMFSPAFVCVLLTMGYELGSDMLGASQLAQNLSATKVSLRDTEERMDRAIHAAGIGLWNWNIAAGTSWISDQGCRILGFGPGETVDTQRFLERVHLSDRGNLDSALLAAAENGGEFVAEYRIVLPSGSARWIATRGQVDFNGGHTPLRMNGVLVDVTERKQAEERFRLVVDTAPTAMLMIDAEGVIALANRQAETLFGFSQAELLGTKVDLIVPTLLRPGREGSDDGLGRATNARTMGSGHDLYGYHTDGTQIPIEMVLNPIPIESELFILASITDLSERNRMERESAMQRDELAHLSRVAMLAELSGSLAHELNQPLTAILTNAQAAVRFLAHVPPNLAEVRDSLANIVDSDKHAGEVIRRLRALLRKEEADYRDVDVNELVGDVLRIIRSDLLNRNVDFVVQLAPELALVHGDPVQLQQVLLNLIMNATDSMNQGARRGQLRVTTSMPKPQCVEVAVRDQGRGIPEDDIERIFAPFVTSKENGLGLGLAVCKTIINAHAGSLWAVNNTDIGATVSFSLPASGTSKL